MSLRHFLNMGIELGMSRNYCVPVLYRHILTDTDVRSLQTSTHWKHNIFVHPELLWFICVSSFKNHFTYHLFPLLPLAMEMICTNTRCPDACQCRQHIPISLFLSFAIFCPVLFHGKYTHQQLIAFRSTSCSCFHILLCRWKFDATFLNYRDFLLN